MAIKALDQEIRDDNKIVASWLLYYYERKQDYLNYRERILHGTGRPEGPSGGQTYQISNPTAAKASKLADMQETERWLALVEEVEYRLPEKMVIYLHLRQEYRHSRGRNGWVAPVQWRFAHELAQRLGKRPEDTWVESRKTFTRWWDRIVEYAARLAAKKGLL